MEMEEVKKNKEQVAEHLTRIILDNRKYLLENFCRAYAAQISHFHEDFTIESICLIEQEPHIREGCLTRRYWFEYKPKLDDVTLNFSE